MPGRFGRASSWRRCGAGFDRPKAIAERNVFRAERPSVHPAVLPLHICILLHVDVLSFATTEPTTAARGRLLAGSFSRNDIEVPVPTALNRCPDPVETPRCRCSCKVL